MLIEVGIKLFPNDAIVELLLTSVFPQLRRSLTDNGCFLCLEVWLKSRKARYQSEINRTLHIRGEKLRRSEWWDLDYFMKPLWRITDSLIKRHIPNYM